ncbi:MAG TPA: glucose-6-phosphate isomerase [Gammaproteobacteria bacterium]|nr:glucose-6-phosphate isomerase [Gammaproteobacteria bacterium]|tara:strand:- start:1177 stop:2808 length:1632 start_codon:yes stop_codon:yes gene_type:complete
MSVTQLPSWQALNVHARRLRDTRIESLFDRDPDRLKYLCQEAVSIYVDMSKTLVDRASFDSLLQLAEERQLTDAIAAIFDGEVVNPTENQPALHTLLRERESIVSDALTMERFGQVGAIRQEIADFSDRMNTGKIRGFSGSRIKDVVNIGIGGSHLGAQMVCDALRCEHLRDVGVHFVSNVDGSDLERVLTPLEPDTTYFIVTSKSFKTAETLLNAKSASSWITENFKTQDALPSHFAAITSKPERAIAFGIDPKNIFPISNWVGGRYSLWSAVGLAISIAIGNDGFNRLLLGAHEMDQHFRTATFENNIPIMLALIGIWNTNFLGCETHAIVPYDDRLRFLPAYLQQLEMESNGKRITLKNTLTDYHTVPIVWGGVGTNAQHAFFQQMHQGTRKTSTDFILVLAHQRASQEHRDMLVANCLAQAESLMRGQKRDTLNDSENPTEHIDLPAHRETPGNRPNTTIVTDSLTPESLGALLALFEHKTYIQGIIWDINSFDQWGVELGKTLANSIMNELSGTNSGTHDPSTKALLARFKRVRDGIP